MNKKYYDGGIVTEILLTHLEPEKMLEVLTAFAEAKGLDAVEVIRCKDCKYWHCDDSESYCDEIGIFGTDMNSYCSFAKRKEE